jgi:hypothetical protein
MTAVLTSSPRHLPGGTTPPVPQPRCRVAAIHPCRAADLAKIVLSRNAAPPLQPLLRISDGLLRRPAHHAPTPSGR